MFTENSLKRWDECFTKQTCINWIIKYLLLHRRNTIPLLLHRRENQKLHSGISSEEIIQKPYSRVSPTTQERNSSTESRGTFYYTEERNFVLYYTEARFRDFIQGIFYYTAEPIHLLLHRREIQQLNSGASPTTQKKLRLLLHRRSFRNWNQEYFLLHRRNFVFYFTEETFRNWNQEYLLLHRRNFVFYFTEDHSATERVWNGLPNKN